jgi:hypothetical protein
MLSFSFVTSGPGRVSIQFDDLQLTKHVDGEVSELDDDIYQMDVSSSDGAVACTLTNLSGTLEAASVDEEAAPPPVGVAFRASRSPSCS